MKEENRNKENWAFIDQATTKEDPELVKHRNAALKLNSATIFWTRIQYVSLILYGTLFLSFFFKSLSPWYWVFLFTCELGFFITGIRLICTVQYSNFEKYKTLFRIAVGICVISVIYVLIHFFIEILNRI